MKKLLFCLSLLIFFGCTMMAQNYYSKNIDFEGQSDSGNNIHQKDDGFLITGTSLCFDTLVECFSILSTDEYGEIINFEKISNFPLWAAAGTGTGNGGILMKNQDEIYIAGAIQIGTPQYDVFLIKTNGQGDTLWMKTYGSPGYDESTKAMVFSQDSSLILFNAYALNPYKLLVWLLKVDLNGNVIWEKYFGESYKNAGYQDMIKLDNEDILFSYVTSEYNVPSNPYSMTVTKMDAQGNEKWTSRFSSFDGDISGTHSCILELDNGGYLVNFVREAFGASLTPPIFIWLDSMGNVTQQYDFPNTRVQIINDLIKTADGRIVGVGQVDLIDYDMGYAGWVFSFTQSGELLWQRFLVDQRFLPEKLSWLSGVEEMDDGRLAAIGTIDTPADIDAWLVVLDEMGCLEPGCTGELQGYFSATESVDEPVPQLTIYPNPASGEVVYLLGLDKFPQDGQAVLRIHDLTGRMVRSQSPSTEVDISGLPPGLYFVSMIDGEGARRGIGRFLRS